MVWSEPMLRVAARFSVSSSYMARVCTLLNVTRPECGYWAKLAVGKAPKQPPLPEPRLGGPLEWWSLIDYLTMHLPASIQERSVQLGDYRPTRSGWQTTRQCTCKFSSAMVVLLAAFLLQFA